MKKKGILKLFNLVVIGLMFFSVNACGGDNTEDSSDVQDKEDVFGPVIGHVTDMKGLVGVNSTLGWYFRSVTEGTYDEVVHYFPVNMPDTLKQSDIHVVFSGDIAEMSAVPNIGGLTYYKIRLSSSRVE